MDDSGVSAAQVTGPALVLRKVRSFLRRLIILQRPIPHGLFSFSILLNRSDPQIRLHRFANFAQRDPWPLPMWICIQTWLAFRWRLRNAEAETDRVVATYGAAVEADEGIPIVEQRQRVLNLARRYCMTPEALYENRLYRNPSDALDFVFPHETMGLHKHCNGATRTEVESALHDKVLFTARATQAGLPVVPNLAILAKGSSADVAMLACQHTGDLFLKRRAGFGGHGAFSLRMKDGSVEGRMLDGRPLVDEAATRSALQGLLAQDDVLVQPLLVSHPVLRPVASFGSPPVLRIVTRWMPRQDRMAARAGEPEILVAFLQVTIPVHTTTGQPTTVDVVGAIDAESGLVTRNPRSVLALRPETRLLEDLVFDRLGTALSIPFWPEIRQQAQKGHQTFSALWAIGWDLIVTPDGPIFLEGNVYWDTGRPQEIVGGLIWAARDARDCGV